MTIEEVLPGEAGFIEEDVRLVHSGPLGNAGASSLLKGFGRLIGLASEPDHSTDLASLERNRFRTGKPCVGCRIRYVGGVKKPGSRWATEMLDRFYNYLTGKSEYLASRYTVTGWEYIRRIGRSPAFGSIIFFPLVAAFLTLSGKVQTILFLPFPVDVSVRVHLFYWALFSLFLGTSIYAFRCPGMFNKYDNHLEYAKSELKILKHPTFARDTTKFIERRLSTYKGEVGHLHPAAVRQLEGAIERVQVAVADTSEGCVPESVLAPLLLAHWQFMNRTDPRSRVAIYALYVIGLTLIAIISALSVGDVLLSYIW